MDDSRSVRLVLRSVLRDLGYETVEAGDGREALDILAKDSAITLMLVDWNMPVMTGLQFVFAVRSDERLDGIPIMMITTEVSMGHVEAALSAGANEYLMKPFDRDQLATKLRLIGLL